MGVQNLGNLTGQPVTYDSRLKKYFSEAGSNACSVGFIASKDGRASHDLVRKAILAKANTYHRGGYAADGKTTDGDGLETEIPQNLFRDLFTEQGGSLGDDERVAVGQLFLPRNEEQRNVAWRIIEEELKAAGLDNFVKRDTPVDLDYLGPIGRETMPHAAQIIFPVTADEEQRRDVETVLERAHQRMNSRFEEAGLINGEPDTCHIASFSGERIIYKGRSDPRDNAAMWPDLADERFESRWAIIHNRFTTAGNTEIRNIQPLPGGCAHNGTITTQKGLTKATAIHQTGLANALGEGGEDILPIERRGMSDSALIDRIASAKLLAGVSPERIKMTLFPKGANRGMDYGDDVLATRRVLANTMETADGPALFVIPDRGRIVLTLDSNGSRPAAIQETDELFAIGSEAGMWQFDLENELTRTDTLRAGQMVSFDSNTGEVAYDKALEQQVSHEADFVAMNERIQDIELDASVIPQRIWDDQEHSVRMRNAGHTSEDVDKMLMGMVTSGVPVNGSMGETSIARGAGTHRKKGIDFYTFPHNQITAPPHNADLDGDMMDLSARFAYPADHEGNLREKVHVIPDRFVLGTDMLDQAMDQIGSSKFRTIDCTFDRDTETYEKALERIADEAEKWANKGKHIILSDDKVEEGAVPVYMEHATGAAHTRLNEKGSRGDVAIIVKSAECTGANGVSALKALGATIVVPYLMEQHIIKMQDDGKLVGKDGFPLPLEDALANFYNAIKKGVRVAMQRTLTLSANSMQGAMQVEALGLDRGLVGRIHPGVVSKISGLTGNELGEQLVRYHDELFRPEGLDHSRVFDADGEAKLHTGGRKDAKAGGVKHGSNSASVYALRYALGIDPKGFGYMNPDKEPVEFTDEKGWDIWKSFYLKHARGAHNPAFVVDGLSFKTDGITPLNPDVDEMESADDLAAGRIVSGGMSIGAISLQAHKDLHFAANEVGFQSNTGEGGYPQELFGTKFMPKIVQWSTNAYGIRPELLCAAEVIEFKFGQGAKSGEGGNMPAKKVTPLLSRLRFIPEGREQQSSPLYMDMRSIEDLASKIRIARRINPEAENRLKIVTKDGCAEEALGAVKAAVGAIEQLAAEGVPTNGKISLHVSGRRGGTASAKEDSKDGSGSDWEPYLPEIHRILKENGLRDRVEIVVDGGFAHGEDMAKALILGADRIGFGTLFMQSLGCTLQKQCHTGKCMTDVAVAKELEDLENYIGKPEYAMRLAKFLGRDLQRVMAKLGVKNARDLQGRTDLLEANEFAKQHGWDFSEMLEMGHDPEPDSHFVQSKVPEANEFVRSIDHKLLAENPNLIEEGGTFNFDVNNMDDGVGTTISGLVSDYLLSKTKSLDEADLKEILRDDHITLNAKGTLGYASGALLTQGVTLNLTGIAGDSFGSNMRAGVAVIKYPKGLKIGANQKESAVLAQSMLGAFMTGGEIHVGGTAGNDTAFRQSGGLVVTRGAGKAAQFKTRGTFVAWKEGVDDGSFANHQGGECFIRKEGFTAGDLTQTFQAQQPKVHFEALQDPEAKQRLREHLIRSFELTQDPELYELLTERNWDEVSAEFMHVRTFVKAPANDDCIDTIPDVPVHPYPRRPLPSPEARVA